jgi:Domain of unknown function (DUF5916)/Carbohydrate family 9 binding domain-like
MKKMFRYAGILLALFSAFQAHAALEALRLAPGEKIVLDGNFDEPAWQRARASTEFYELFPLEKVHARVETEVRFAYDATALYVALRVFDPDMSRLRAPFARRDSVLADQDFVALFIDPVGARKFAHFVRVNPRGVIADGLYNEDSNNEDFSPDFEVDAVTGRFDGGWTAEVRIPFSSLRYTDASKADWSALVLRNYPRDQRYRFASSPLPRDYNCFLCLNQPLVGLANLPPTRHLDVTPNFTLRASRDRVKGEPERTDRELVPSIDFKWRPRADVVVDATINPDFSQVELDTPQLAGNNQFALFFNEKRPFFLEGADMLQGLETPAYTRSITDPSWGARVTQRREGVDATILVVKDDGGGTVLLPNAYGTHFAPQDFKSLATIARARVQMEGITLGGNFTDRTLEGGRGYNRVFGPDIVWFPTGEHRVRAQLLGSWTTALPSADGTLQRGPEQTDYNAVADWRYLGNRWDQYALVEHIGEQFRADNGFYNQAGFRRYYSETTRKFRDVGVFNEISPYAYLDYRTNEENERIYQQNYLGLRLGLPRATTLWFELRPNTLVVVRPDGGARKRDQVFMAIESNPFPWFSRFYTELSFGDRVDVANNRVGKGAYLGVTANVRPHQRMEVEFRMDSDFIDSKEPVEGSKRIIQQRAQQLLAIWHFSARDSLRAIWQRTSIRRAPSLWEQPVSARQRNDALSLVYAHRRGIGTTFYLGAQMARAEDFTTGFRRWQVEVFAKGSWTFDVL